MGEAFDDMKEEEEPSEDEDEELVEEAPSTS
jgi:hypothetical protein